MEKLRFLLIQPDIRWEDPAGNLELLEGILDLVPQGTHLVILPETFSTGFTMDVECFAEGKEGASVSWMRRIAASKGLYLAGSLIIRDGAGIFNRLYWISPEGIEDQYDKRHLFRMGREELHFYPGSERKVFRLNEYRFMPQICYDIRFPVFSRNRNDYDILFYSANWPASRQHVWDTLLRARAIENQAIVLGVNRTGTDGEGVEHQGGTCIINYLGEVVDSLDRRPGVLSGTIDLEQIREFRKRFPVWKDADRFALD
jgi:predicted amidohydrolase